MSDDDRRVGEAIVKAIVILVVVVIVGFGLLVGVCGLMLR